MSEPKMKPALRIPFEQAYGRTAQRRTTQPRLWRIVSLLSLCVLLSWYLPAPRFLSSLQRATLKTQPLSAGDDPGAHWKDDVWPIREQTPWDISTDYPFPRVLEYDVTEGTWLRLDVHPVTGDIIFDMVGDIYCLPGKAYADGAHASGSLTRAVPVLLGVPHDSDPHFSPKGDRIVFRSDAGLGVENIWTTEWRGCSAMDVRPPDATGALLHALQLKDEEEELLADGVKETFDRRLRRLMREGRSSGMYEPSLHTLD